MTPSVEGLNLQLDGHRRAVFGFCRCQTATLESWEQIRGKWQIIFQSRLHWWGYDVLSGVRRLFHKTLQLYNMVKKMKQMLNILFCWVFVLSIHKTLLIPEALLRSFFLIAISGAVAESPGPLYNTMDEILQLSAINPPVAPQKALEWPRQSLWRWCGMTLKRQSNALQCGWIRTILQRKVNQSEPKFSTVM